MIRVIDCNDLHKNSGFVLAQNFDDYRICIDTDAEIGEPVEDIPAGFEQICLPSNHGRFLNLSQIKDGLAWESEHEQLAIVTADRDNLLSDMAALIEEVYEMDSEMME